MSHVSPAEEQYTATIHNPEFGQRLVGLVDFTETHGAENAFATYSVAGGLSVSQLLISEDSAILNPTEVRAGMLIPDNDSDPKIETLTHSHVILPGHSVADMMYPSSGDLLHGGWNIEPGLVEGVALTNPVLGQISLVAYRLRSSDPDAFDPRFLTNVGNPGWRRKRELMQWAGLNVAQLRFNRQDGRFLGGPIADLFRQSS